MLSIFYIPQGNNPIEHRLLEKFTISSFVKNSKHIKQIFDNTQEEEFV